MTPSLATIVLSPSG